jgi:copper homeostasis protein
MYIIIEVPCGNIESVIAAKKGGADRIELCSALPLGGLTPTPGMLEEILEVSIIKFVMIRPREGNFVYSPAEFRSMLSDIELMKKAGAQGIVSGVLLKNNKIDLERTRELKDASRPMPFTFHRAFDLTPDPFRSLDELIEIKANRLLTSGQAIDAFSGKELIRKLVKQADDRLEIIAGAGINSENVLSIIESGIKEIHLSGKMKKEKMESNRIRMGYIDESLYVTDEERIKMVRSKLIV